MVSVMSKVVASAGTSIAEMVSGASVALGEFGLCGIPSNLIDAVYDKGISDLWAISNNCRVDDRGLGRLIKARRISRMTCSFIGENLAAQSQPLSGKIMDELVPQGTLADRPPSRWGWHRRVLHTHWGREPARRRRYPHAL